MNSQTSMTGDCLTGDCLSTVQNTIDAALLNPVVSKALRQPAYVNNWSVKALTDYAHEVKPNVAGVFRLAGTATTGTGEACQWSVILKVLKSPAGMIMPGDTLITEAMANDRQAFGYWKREAAAYRSGLIDDLPHGLAAPACFGMLEAEDHVWLWQAEVADTATWSWAHYREAAYRLGLWQGQYVTGERVMPDHPWLSRNWLRQWVGLPLTKIVGMLDQAGGWSLPIIACHFSARELEQVRNLWAARGQRLTQLAHLPRVLCHLDAYRANFLWQGDTLMLIDWEFAGAGALGEELAAFVGATLLLDHVPMADAQQLETIALDGYGAGLREAGWDGGLDIVCEAYRCAMPLRYAVMSLASMCRTAWEPDFGVHWERKAGKPLAAILEHRADFVRFMLSCDRHDRS